MDAGAAPLQTPPQRTGRGHAPSKRFDCRLVSYLTEQEITALLAVPDRRTWTGRRDHTLLMLACQTGLRASELIHLTVSDVHRRARLLPRQGPQAANYATDHRHGPLRCVHG
jgi:site-specific recombinase XerD